MTKRILKLGFLAIALILVFMAYTAKFTKDSIAKSGQILSFEVQKPNLVVRGLDLAGVEVWAIPQGLEVGKNDYILLGQAELKSVFSDGQVWVLQIPNQPAEGFSQISEIFAKGYNLNGQILGKIFLPYHSPEEIFNALWRTEIPPYEITKKDSGRNFDYLISSKITLVLDQNQYPKAELDCYPQGVINEVNDAPRVSEPLYSKRFEASAAGTCILQNRDFAVAIKIVN